MSGVLYSGGGLIAVDHCLQDDSVHYNLPIRLQWLIDKQRESITPHRRDIRCR